MLLERMGGCARPCGHPPPRGCVIPSLPSEICADEQQSAERPSGPATLANARPNRASKGRCGDQREERPCAALAASSPTLYPYRRTLLGRQKLKTIHRSHASAFRALGELSPQSPGCLRWRSEATTIEARRPLSLRLRRRCAQSNRETAKPSAASAPRATKTHICDRLTAVTCQALLISRSCADVGNFLPTTASGVWVVAYRKPTIERAASPR